MTGKKELSRTRVGQRSDAASAARRGQKKDRKGQERQRAEDTDKAQTRKRGRTKADKKSSLINGF